MSKLTVVVTESGAWFYRTEKGSPLINGIEVKVDEIPMLIRTLEDAARVTAALREETAA